AANAICLNRGRAPRRHVSRLYERVARRKGHQKAIGAVARHLAEATYWILTKQKSYREPTAATVSSTGDKRGSPMSYRKLGPCIATSPEITIMPPYDGEDMAPTQRVDEAGDDDGVNRQTHERWTVSMTSGPRPGRVVDDAAGWGSA